MVNLAAIVANYVSIFEEIEMLVAPQFRVKLFDRVLHVLARCHVRMRVSAMTEGCRLRIFDRKRTGFAIVS